MASMREGTELLADQVVGPLTPSKKRCGRYSDDSSRNLQKLIEQLLKWHRKLAVTVPQFEAVVISRRLWDMVASAHKLLPARAKMMHTDVDRGRTLHSIHVADERAG